MVKCNIVLSNKALCSFIDLDECALGLNKCSHICTNLNGTFSCSCQPGFTLVDGTSGVCRADDPNVSKIIKTAKTITNLVNSCYLHLTQFPNYQLIRS